MQSLHHRAVSCLLLFRKLGFDGTFAFYINARHCELVLKLAWKSPVFEYPGGLPRRFTPRNDGAANPDFAGALLRLIIEVEAPVEVDLRGEDDQKGCEQYPALPAPQLRQQRERKQHQYDQSGPGGVKHA